MTQPATTRSINRQSGEFNPARLAFGAAFMGGASAIAAGLFTTISPLGGVIFGVSSFFSGRLIHWICDKINCYPESIIFKVAQFGLSMIGGIATGMLMMKATGFPITMMTGILLTVSSATVVVSSLLALVGCCCSSAVVTGMALGFYNAEA